MNNSRTSGLTASVAILLASPPLVHAAVVQSELMNGTVQSFYDGNISGADLINTGSTDLTGFTTTVTPSFAALGTHDGIANPGGTSRSGDGLGYWGNSPGGVTLEYTLDSVTNPLGYEIISINSIYGWTDSRTRHAAHRYSVEVATVSNPTFSPLHTVAYDPWTTNGVGSTQVTLTDTTGILATGVTAIRFNLASDNGREIGVIRELDVFGSAITGPVPEPSRTVLLGLGALALILRRRR